MVDSKNGSYSTLEVSIHEAPQLLQEAPQAIQIANSSHNSVSLLHEGELQEQKRAPERKMCGLRFTTFWLSFAVLVDFSFVVMTHRCCYRRSNGLKAFCTESDTQVRSCLYRKALQSHLKCLISAESLDSLGAVNSNTLGIGSTITTATSVPSSTRGPSSRVSTSIQTPEVPLVSASSSMIVDSTAATATSVSISSGGSLTISTLTALQTQSLLSASSRTYALNTLSIKDNIHFANLPGIVMQFQGDGNVVVLNTTANPNKWTLEWANGKTIANGGSCEEGVDKATLCSMTLGGDGNLYTSFNGTTLWSSGTSGTGNEMLCIDEVPWIQIKDAGGNVIWDTSDSM